MRLILLAVILVTGVFAGPQRKSSLLRSKKVSNDDSLDTPLDRYGQPDAPVSSESGLESIIYKLREVLEMIRQDPDDKSINKVPEIEKIIEYLKIQQNNENSSDDEDTDELNPSQSVIQGSKDIFRSKEAPAKKYQDTSASLKNTEKYMPHEAPKRQPDYNSAYYNYFNDYDVSDGDEDRVEFIPTGKTEGDDAAKQRNLKNSPYPSKYANKPGDKIKQVGSDAVKNKLFDEEIESINSNSSKNKLANQASQRKDSSPVDYSVNEDDLLEKSENNPNDRTFEIDPKRTLNTAGDAIKQTIPKKYLKNLSEELENNPNVNERLEDSTDEILKASEKGRGISNPLYPRKDSIPEDYSVDEDDLAEKLENIPNVNRSWEDSIDKILKELKKVGGRNNPGYSRKDTNLDIPVNQEGLTENLKDQASDLKDESIKKTKNGVDAVDQEVSKEYSNGKALLRKNLDSGKRLTNNFAKKAKNLDKVAGDTVKEKIPIKESNPAGVSDNLNDVGDSTEALKGAGKIDANIGLYGGVKGLESSDELGFNVGSGGKLGGELGFGGLVKMGKPVFRKLESLFK